MENLGENSFLPQLLAGVLLASFLCCYGAPISVADDTKIRAMYTEPRGTDLSWWIQIPDPAPAVVIVTQFILPGSTIKESSPPVSSYDREKGVAKWLLTGIKPGRLTMTLKVDKPIRKKGEIRGEIIFQDRNANTTASVFMQKEARKKAIEGC